MSEEKKHFMWGDIAKGIAIILVIMGHSYKPGGEVCHFIFMFHMPLFFFLAGYFFNFEKYSEKFGEFVKLSAQRLLIPALVSTIILYNITQPKTIKMLIYAIGKPIPEWGINPIGYSMWFLFCLFLVRILLFGFIKLTNKINIPIIINIALAFGIAYCGTLIGHVIKLPWSLDIALVSLYIAYIGYITKEFKIIDKKIYMFILILLGIILGYIDYKYFGLSMNERFYSKSPFVSINTSIILSIIVIYIAKFVEKTKMLFLDILLQYIGLNSIIIMIFHGLPRSSVGPGIRTLWKLFICILVIEFLALITFFKKAYGAVSIVEIVKKNFDKQ